MKFAPPIRILRHGSGLLIRAPARSALYDFPTLPYGCGFGWGSCHKHKDESKRRLGTRLEAFFKEFVDQLLLKEFESILTVNHPYRFRDAIVDLARRISYTPETMQVLAEEYAANTMASDVEDRRMVVADDLLAIESIFEQIGEMYERIETFRRQLEARVRNTIKYAERGGQGLVGRAGDLVRWLDFLLRRGKYDRPTVEWSIEPLRFHWSEYHQAPVRQPRRPVEARELAGPPSDPLYELRKQLRLEYIARIAPRPEEVRRFLEGQVPPFAAKEARFIEIGTVDDFLAFDCARRYALTGEVPAQIATGFHLELSPDTPPHDSEWLRCANFVVRRSGRSRQTGATRA